MNQRVRGGGRIAALHDPATARWLSSELGLDGALRIEALPGGNSNETYLLRANARRFVLRCPPVAPLAAGAHNMERESRVLGALAGTDVRVPRPLAFCGDEVVPGAPFLLMEYVDGVSLTDRLPPSYGPDGIRSVGYEMVDGLARLHAVDFRAVGLEGFGRPEGFLERQVGRWTRQFELQSVRKLPLFGRIGAWMEENRPPSTEPAIIHGDFHLDNCLFGRDEPRLQAIIDWEMATVGDPLLDLGLALAFWGRRDVEPCAMPRIEAVSRLEGSPERDELVERYARATGRPVAHMPYYLCLAFWKLAAIVEGAYAQYVEGLVDNEYSADLAQDVPLLLEEAARFAGCRTGA